MKMSLAVLELSDVDRQTAMEKLRGTILKKLEQKLQK
jgi:hypothetical protein